MESFPSETIRTTRYSDKFSNKEIYRPPIFDYKATLQQDQRKFRYVQQQQVDLANLLSRKRLRKFRNTDNFDMEFAGSENNQGNWRQIVKRDTTTAKINLEKENNSRQETVSSKRLAREPIMVNNDHIDRQDGVKYRIYVPNILQQNFGLDAKTAEEVLKKQSPLVHTKEDEEIAALNDLIGKNPNVQLEGLKKLLENPSSPIAEGNRPYSLRDHTPITEKTVDVPNPQDKPNIKVNHGEDSNQENGSKSANLQDSTIAALQAHLDATSKAQAEQVLAKAAQDALAHVQAQHNAIALAHADAQKAALAQVVAQNQLRYHQHEAIEEQATHTHRPTEVVFEPKSNYHLPFTASQPTYIQNEAVEEEQEQDKPAEVVLVPKQNFNLQQATGKPAVPPFQHVILETSRQTENVKKIYTRRKPAIYKHELEDVSSLHVIKKRDLNETDDYYDDFDYSGNMNISDEYYDGNFNKTDKIDQNYDFPDYDDNNSTEIESLDNIQPEPLRRRLYKKRKGPHRHRHSLDNKTKYHSHQHNDNLETVSTIKKALTEGKGAENVIVINNHNNNNNHNAGKGYSGINGGEFKKHPPIRIIRKHKKCRYCYRKGIRNLHRIQLKVSRALNKIQG